MSYRNLYPENWNDIIAIVKKRDKYTCSDCRTVHPKHSKWLHVHHIKSLSQGGSNNLSNLITLCYKCHKKYHPHMGNYKNNKLKFNKPFIM